MLVKIKKQIEETIELELPAYFKNKLGTISKITENNIITVSVVSVYVIQKNSNIENLYNETVRYTITGEQSNNAEFMNVFNAMMALINPLINNAVII